MATSSNELNSPNYSILFSMAFELFFVWTRCIHNYTYNQCQLYIFNCMSYVDFNACFFADAFQPMNAALAFRIGLNDCARAIRGKFTLAAELESCSESGPSIWSHLWRYGINAKVKCDIFPQSTMSWCLHSFDTLIFFSYPWVKWYWLIFNICPSYIF